MCCPQLTLNLEEDYNPGTFNGSKQTRKCTDLFGLLIVVLIFGTVIGLTSYCISNSQIEKIENGYDECGNICGKNNINTTSNSIPCFGVDMEELKYISIHDFGPLFPKGKECLRLCVLNYQIGYCVDDIKLVPLLWLTWKSLYFIVIGWVIPFSIMWMIYDYFKNTKSTRAHIICILLCFMLEFWGLTGLVYSKELPTYLIIILSMCAIVTLWIFSTLPFLFTRKMTEKIRLTEIFISEVYKIDTDLRLHIWPPILASITVTAFFFLTTYCAIYIVTFSYLKQFNKADAFVPDVDYVTYPIASVTQALLIFAFLLFHELVKNTQCMLVGGCVSQWYFTQRNPEPTATIVTETSLNNIVKYHLGSICWGSMLLALTFPARFIINGIIWAVSVTRKQWFCTNIRFRLSKTPWLICFGLFSRSGFTMAAIHGCSFCAGTIRAHKLLANNPFGAISLYTFADWLLGFLKFCGWMGSFSIAVLVLVFIGAAFSVDQWRLTINFVNVVMFNTIISYFVIDLVIGVFETTKDTLVLCFCEDCLFNDGASNPYHMSPEFAQFVENANKFIDPTGWELISDHWNRGPKRLY